MMTPEEAIRFIIDRAFELDGAPEGLELFRWHWVPSSHPVWYLHIPPPRAGAQVVGADIPLATPVTDTFMVRPSELRGEIVMQHGRPERFGLGWNVEHRAAVLFFLGGGELNLKRRVDRTDVIAATLTAQGARIRFFESLEEIRDMLRDMRDDGDEWKRGGAS